MRTKGQGRRRERVRCRQRCRSRALVHVDGNDLSEETERRGSAWRAPLTSSEGSPPVEDAFHEQRISSGQYFRSSQNTMCA